ncbi:MAG: purine biosynthesis protein PurH [Eubacterium sp.]|nr:purine biosynthesis protein PurH [Eubacterium sp.]
MNSYFIKDTTREERQKIVDESLGNISGQCDGCSQGIIDMYDDYIEGRRELKDINAEFRARYTVDNGPEHEQSGCGYTK